MQKHTAIPRTKNVHTQRTRHHLVLAFALLAGVAAPAARAEGSTLASAARDGSRTGQRCTRAQCPAGLTPEQWDRVRRAAELHMSPTARRLTMRLLHAGEIRPWDGIGPDGEDHRSAAGAVLKERPGTVYINTRFDGELVSGVPYVGSVFEAAPVLLAESLLHEIKHTLQLRGLSPAQRDAAFEDIHRLDEDAEQWALANVRLHVPPRLDLRPSSPAGATLHG